MGSQESQLRQQLVGKPVQFLGRLNEVQMAEAYHNWDFLICTSDYETGPLVALEAMAAGVMPIMPDIPCQATSLLRENGFATYPQGDLAAAAALIADLAGQKNQTASRKKIRRLVAERKPELFVARLSAELGKILEAPGRSRRMGTPCGLAELLPFAIRSRLPGQEVFLR
ncbi:MAG: glycosyltransferase [Limisphaerales bacterium]